MIVGAGQAGLSLSHELMHAGVEHVVLERGNAGESWRRRWDSFRLVVPNWTVRLPGAAYNGGDPEGFMAREEIAEYLSEYAESFRAPIRTGVDVSAVDLLDDDTFALRTSGGAMHTSQVVLASGGYQRPHRPAAAVGLPQGRLQVIDAENYTNPNALPPGGVLVIGSGQTGCQLAEEIYEAGRPVFLACGRAPWLPRRLEGRDVIGWLMDAGFYETSLADFPSPAIRYASNPQFTGHEGGRDLNFRTLQALGVTLLGRFLDVEDGRAVFADDLQESVSFGDSRYSDIRKLIADHCSTRGVKAPEMSDPPPFTVDPPRSLDLGQLGTVIFTTGFRPDYTSWVRPSNAFDEAGFPIQADGSSTVVPGLHFMGVHFQRKRKSATLFGVAEDAVVLGERIASSVRG